MFFTVYDPLQLVSYPSVTLQLGGGKGMKKKKNYSFLSPVWKFKYERIGGNGKIINLFGSLSEGNEIEHSFLLIPSKPQIFIPQIYIKRLSSKSIFMFNLINFSFLQFNIFPYAHYRILEVNILHLNHPKIIHHAHYHSFILL